VSNIIKLSLNVTIEETIDLLKQMNSVVKDNDLNGAKHFLNRVNDMIMEIEDDISAMDELVYDEV
jgi:hypothetical protein